MVEVNHEQLMDAIIHHYKTRRPMFIEGAVGIGKSWTVREACKELAREYNIPFIDTKTPNRYPNHFCLIDMRLAQKDPSDLLGLPETYAIINQGNNLLEIPIKALNTFLHNNNNARVMTYVTRWNSPSILPLQGRGILFLDELNLSPPLVQSASYELIYDRRLGEYTLPEGYICIGAGNRLQDKAYVFEMAKPLQNRFCWYTLLPPSVEVWTKWAMNNNIDHRIISFINARQSYLNQQFDIKKKDSKAYATPRSWHFASDLIKNVKDYETIRIRVASAVGEGCANDFVSFLTLSSKLPPVKEYIKYPEVTMIPKEELDLVYALCSNLAEYFRTHKDKRTLKSIVIISRRFIEELSAEYAEFLLKLVKLVDKAYFESTIVTLKEFEEKKRGISVQEELQKYLL